MKDKLGVGEDLSLLFIDTKEIDLEIEINERSKDHDEVKGVTTLRTKVNLGDATKIINVMQNKPIWVKEGILHKRWRVEDNTILLKEDLEDRLGQELKSKIFSVHISQTSSGDIYGNPVIREAMENATQVELRKTLSMWGLTLQNFYVNMEAGVYDELMSYKRQKEIEMQKEDIDFAPLIKDMERDHNIKKKNLEHAFELKKIGILQDEDIQDILQEKDIKRQRELIKFTEEKRQSTINIEWQEHVQDMKELFGEIYIKKYGVPGVLDIKERMEQWKRAREQQQVELQIKMYQGTQLESKKVDANVEIEKARMDAEKAKHDLETYERALEKERKHQVEMTDQMAKLTQAAKPDVPQTLVQGGSPTPIVSVQTQEPLKEEAKCPSCNAMIQADWISCPYCTTKLK